MTTVVRGILRVLRGPLVRAAWRGALAVVALAVCVAVLGLGVAAARGYRPVVVLTGSMGGTAPAGSLAIAGPTDDVELGDVVVMRREGRATVTHRVVDLGTDADGAPFAITRGDANPDIDPEPYALSDRELTVRWVIPDGGTVLLQVRSPAIGLAISGFVVLVGVIAALKRIWMPRPARGVPIAPRSVTPRSGGRGGFRGSRWAVALATVAGMSTAGSGVVVSLYLGVADVTANQFTTLACYDARLDSVQTGQLTTGADGATTVAIAAVDPARSFLWFSASSASGDPDDTAVLGRLTTATTIEFERDADGAPPADVVVEWSVIEYGCGVTVQRGAAVGTGDTQIDVPITAVDTAASFVTVSSTSLAGSTAFGASELRTVELVDAETLRIRSEGPIVAGSVHAWQVVSFDNGTDAAVQVVAGTMTAGETVATLPLATPVDPGSTFVLASVRSANGGPAIGDRMVRARLLDDATVEIARQVGTGSVTVSVQVVELRDGSTVAHGVLDLAAGETTDTATFPPVTPARSTAVATVMAPAGASGGSTSMTADDVAGEGAARLRIVDARTVELTRDAQAAAASFAWQVVTWGGPVWADLDAPFRRRIDVTAGSVVTPDGYTTSLVFDHAQMVADDLSLADGSDVRIWRHDGSAWVELDRVLDDASAWDSATTTVWFRTAESIAAASTATYWMYFGDDTPDPPLADPANVWLAVEDFDDGSLGLFEDRTGGTGWYSADPWTRRIALTIPAATVAADLTDEQVLVRLTSPDLAAVAQVDGSDLRFTAADGSTVLAHEIEAFDQPTGTLTAWVTVPTVSASGPTTLYLYAGAPDAPAQDDPRATWSGAGAVWQMAADPGGAAPALDDAGDGQFDGIALADASLTDSPTGPAIALDGALDRLESSPIGPGRDALSATAWFRADGVGVDQVLVAHGDPTVGGVFDLSIDASAALTARLRLGADLIEVSGGSVGADDWHHAAAVWNGSVLRLYLDGVEVASAAAAGTVAVDAPIPVVVGAAPDGGRAMAGDIGQVRMSGDAWGPVRIAFMADNLRDPGTVVVASPAATGTWFDQGDWTVRRPLVVSADMVAGTLADYPLLVQLTDADLATDAQADGDDLVVTASDGITRLDHQIESWDHATGALTAWVRVPTLDATADTTLYLYLGNPTATDQQDPAGVWGPDLDLVVLD